MTPFKNFYIHDIKNLFIIYILFVHNKPNHKQSDDKQDDRDDVEVVH